MAVDLIDAYVNHKDDIVRERTSNPKGIDMEVFLRIVVLKGKTLRIGRQVFDLPSRPAFQWKNLILGNGKRKNFPTLMAISL